MESIGLKTRQIGVVSLNHRSPANTVRRYSSVHLQTTFVCFHSSKINDSRANTAVSVFKTCTDVARMRLLTLDDHGRFIFEKLDEDRPQPYAILSHVWLEPDFEVTFDDIVNSDGRALRKRGYRKLEFCTKQMQKDGIKYLWADTCCIRKSDEYELKTAINSMFRWYRNADRCYVYLSDVGRGMTLEQSRWFTRGWTLQELIAPRNVIFFTMDGEELGTKSSLLLYLHFITNIPTEALQNAPLSSFDADDIFRWAEERKVTVPADKAYCLVGLLDVDFTPKPGETQIEAMDRLRRKVSKKRERNLVHNQDHASNRTPVQRKSNTQNAHQIEGLSSNLSFNEFCTLLHFDQIEARFMNVKRPKFKTCEWILQDPDFLAWLNGDDMSQHHGFFWIKANAGCGKSTLIKFLCTHLMATVTDGRIISFFFNARGEHLEKSTLGLYRHLIIQLLNIYPASFNKLNSSILKQIHLQGVGNSQDLLKEVTIDLIRLLAAHKIFIIIDALDECAEGDVRDMISLWQDLGEHALDTSMSLRFLFASRHYPRVTINKALIMDLNLHPGHSSDLKLYITKELSGGAQPSTADIVNKIFTRSSGIFLWVVLVVPMLNELLDHGHSNELEQKLAEIPSDLGRLFREILRKDNKNTDEMKLCLQWVLFSKEPMYAIDLYFAIQFGLESKIASLPWRFQNISAEEAEKFILSSSKGLTQLSSRNGVGSGAIVEFIHESVRDFLLDENGLAEMWADIEDNVVGRSHDSLKKSCYNCLQSLDARKFPSLSQSSQDEVSKTAPIRFYLEYAVINVLHHAEQAQQAGITQTHFIDDLDVRHWALLHNDLKYKTPVFEVLPEDVDLFYILARYGYAHLINASSRDPLEAPENFRCDYETPFLAALAKNHEAVFDTLVERDKTRQSWDGMYPYQCGQSWHYFWKWEYRGLHQYHERNNLRYKFLELYDSECAILLRTARTDLLHRAVYEGVETLVTRILREAAKNDQLSQHDLDTALNYAAHGLNTSSTVKIVNLLLEAGASVHFDHAKSGTALIGAVLNNNSELIKLLIDKGADVNALASFGEYGTALIAAVGCGYEKLVSLLIDEGADINALATSGRCGTALISAIHYGKGRTFSLLIDEGVDINALATSGEYGTALIAAAYQQNGGTVSLLIEKGVDVNALATSGHFGTALIAAAFWGIEGTILLLIHNGANVNALATFGDFGTALVAVAFTGQAEIISLLIDRGSLIDTVSTTGEFATALAASMCRGYDDGIETARRLINAGADASIAEGAALKEAARREDAEGVSLLLLHCARQINTQAIYYKEAMKIAEEKGNHEALSMLLKHRDSAAEVSSAVMPVPFRRKIRRLFIHFR